MIEIETGIPIPPRSRGRQDKYPWRTMAVGNSFIAKDAKSSSMSTLIAAAQKRNGHKYTRRAVEGGVRIWRVA